MENTPAPSTSILKDVSYAYKPGFIDKTSEESLKMSIDRELADIAKNFWTVNEKTEGNIQRHVRIIEAEMANASARFMEEINVIAEENYALAEKITTLNATVNNNYAELKEELRVETTDRSALAEKVTTLTAHVETENTKLDAMIKEESRIRLEENVLLAERVETITGALSGDLSELEGRITEERRLRIEADEATAEDIFKMEVSFTNDINNLSDETERKIVETNAKVTEETQARVNAIEAVVTDTKRIEAEFKESDRKINADLGTIEETVTQTNAKIVEESESRATAIAAVNTKISDVTAEFKQADLDMTNDYTKKIVDATATVREEIKTVSDAEGATSSKLNIVESNFRLAENNLNSRIDVANANLSQESQDRLKNIAAVRGELNDEIIERLRQDGLLEGKVVLANSKITELANTVDNKDQAMAQKVSTVESNYLSSNAVLTGKVNQEIMDRINAVNGALDKLDEETRQRLAEAGLLSQRIVSANGRIDSVQSTVGNNYTALAQKTDNMAAEYRAIDGRLGGRIDAADARIQKEEETRATAVGAVAERASKMEAVLGGDISNLFIDPQFKTTEHGLKGYGVIRYWGYPNIVAGCPSRNCLEVTGRDNMGKQIAVAAGDRYSFSMDCASNDSAAPAITIGLRYFDSNGNVTAHVGAASSGTKGQWVHIVGEITIPAGVSTVQLWIQIEQAHDGQRWWQITNVSWTNANAVRGPYAAIQSLETAYVEADKAVSAKVDNVKAELKGDFGNVSQTISTTITPQINNLKGTTDGLGDRLNRVESKWGVTVDANGIIGGVSLIADTGVGYSEFKVSADRFVVTSPNGKITPFSISGNYINFEGNVYADKISGGIYTRKEYFCDYNADVQATGGDSRWFTAKRVWVHRGMRIQRFLDISGGYVHYSLETGYASGGSIPTSFSGSLKMNVRVLRDDSVVVASHTAVASFSASVGSGSRYTTSGKFGINLIAIVPNDNSGHWFDLQYQYPQYGLVTSGLSATAKYGSDSNDYFTAQMYIDSGDLG